MPGRHPDNKRPSRTPPWSAAPGRKRVPPHWRDDLDQILIQPRAIEARIKELARAIEADHRGTEMVIVALLTGTVLFLADLVRHLSFPLRLDFMGVSSYRHRTVPGKLVFTKDLSLDVRGRDVLLVDDILDTGRTLWRVIERLKRLEPRRIRVCVLLEKTARRECPVQADYAGFLVPDLFVVGYGLDFNERYRNLPFVGVLKASKQKP